MNLVILSALAGNGVIFLNSTGSLAASAYATANSTVVAPVTVSMTTDQMFKKLSKGGSGGVITVGPVNPPLAIGDDLQSQGESRKVATFAISSEGNNVYFISLPQSVAIKDNSSNNNMTVKAFTNNQPGAGLLIGENQTLTVVGKLNEGELQVAGNYTGNLNITVDCN